MGKERKVHKGKRCEAHWVKVRDARRVGSICEAHVGKICKAHKGKRCQAHRVRDVCIGKGKAHEVHT